MPPPPAQNAPRGTPRKQEKTHKGTSPLSLAYLYHEPTPWRPCRVGSPPSTPPNTHHGERRPATKNAPAPRGGEKHPSTTSWVPQPTPPASRPPETSTRAKSRKSTADSRRDGTKKKESRAWPPPPPRKSKLNRPPSAAGRPHREHTPTGCGSTTPELRLGQFGRSWRTQKFYPTQHGGHRYFFDNTSPFLEETQKQVKQLGRG
ncbi:predicted protein [Nematostella vectensis]|uniref:Uncharacterized protein n=1 Tax=Nematostella vectensis TaxID=45351 RepID=A7STQ4_NEMVE|nr:predicted protein [Nematostella vectensis]|eukprot:XP_001624999.1 predicted protein [Nematostella vectensis]